MKTMYLNIAGQCTAGFNDLLVPRRAGWGGSAIAAKSLSGVPVGRQVFGRVPFQVIDPRKNHGKSMVLLPPNTAEVSFAVGRKFKTFYALHTLLRGDIGRRPVEFVLRYTDGSMAVLPVTVGTDIADWFFPRQFDNCLVGWSGYHPDNEYQKGVFVSGFKNPCPGKEVTCVTLRRGDMYGTYVLLGLTLSDGDNLVKRIVRGAAVGLADNIQLEHDIVRARNGEARVQVEVRNPAGKVIPGVQVRAGVAGRTIGLKALAQGHEAVLKADRQWRRYANTVTLTAVRQGRTIATRQILVYAHGYPRLFTPPHKQRPPQFIILAVDDCKILNGVELMVEMMENLKKDGAKAVFTMYTAPCPGRLPDLAKTKLLYKWMLDQGCEFANHTLNHNPKGMNWYAHPKRVQEQEISGCSQWFRDNIPGVKYVYSIKTGGGGAKGYLDPAFSRQLIKKQRFEYADNNVTAAFETPVPHPDLQLWPYKLGDEWSIDMGLVDANAPSVHRPITKGFYTDYSGKFDYEVPDGIAMLTANLDYHYRSPWRPPLIINACHEWGFGKYYYSHRNQKEILEGFLRNVLVTNRRKYPDTYVITFHQLIKYMVNPDIKTIIAEGNNRDRVEFD